MGKYTKPHTLAWAAKIASFDGFEFVTPEYNLASHEFSRDIPPLVAYGENTLRVVVMVLPFLMPLEVATLGQRRGVRLFVVGTIVYFLSWVPLMIVPQSPWSTSWVGFVAPAYTPLLWLAGLGLIGRRFYVPSAFRWWMYVGLACGTTNVTQPLTTPSTQDRRRRLWPRRCSCRARPVTYKTVPRKTTMTTTSFLRIGLLPLPFETPLME